MNKKDAAATAAAAESLESQLQHPDTIDFWVGDDNGKAAPPKDKAQAEAAADAFAEDLKDSAMGCGKRLLTKMKKKANAAMTGIMGIDQGVLHHIATEGGTSQYVNPHTAGRVLASRSDGDAVSGTDAIFVAGPCAGRGCVGGNGVPDSWMAVDLGEGRALTVDHYALRHGHENSCFRLCNWEMQGSNDGEAWTTLCNHVDDWSMPAQQFSVAHWAVPQLDAAGVATGPVGKARQPYRHFRVQSRGVDSNDNQYLMCGGIELYGTLVEQCELVPYARQVLQQRLQSKKNGKQGSAAESGEQESFAV
eukprot:COSAG01_NODE_3164_length_6477_cov_6.494983_8_plen_306_part_00